MQTAVQRDFSSQDGLPHSEARIVEIVGQKLFVHIFDGRETARLRQPVERGIDRVQQVADREFYSPPAIGQGVRGPKPDFGLVHAGRNVFADALGFQLQKGFFEQGAF